MGKFPESRNNSHGRFSGIPEIPMGGVPESRRFPWEAFGKVESFYGRLSGSSKNPMVHLPETHKELSGIPEKSPWESFRNPGTIPMGGFPESRRFPWEAFRNPGDFHGRLSGRSKVSMEGFPEAQRTQWFIFRKPIRNFPESRKSPWEVFRDPGDSHGRFSGTRKTPI